MVRERRLGLGQSEWRVMLEDLSYTQGLETEEDSVDGSRDETESSDIEAFFHGF